MSSGESEKSNASGASKFKRLTRLWRQPASQDVISANVGENVRNVVVGKNIIQIGSLKIPWLLAVALATGTVATVVALIWIGVNAQRVTQFVMAPTPTPTVTATPIPTATPKPDRMSGAFNIAVADFSEITATGVVSNSQDGHVLSAWVYNALVQSYQSNPATQQLGQVEIWSDSAPIVGKNQPLGSLTSASAAERRDLAAALAERINATMIIYGAIDSRVSPADLWLEFYVAPDLQRTLDPAVGRHNLGGPIGVALPVEATDPLASVALSSSLSTRTSLLFWLTTGMTYDLLGRSEDALHSFQQASQTLNSATDKSGRDLVQFFIGRQYLIMQRLDEAADAYQQALADNADYARAKIGLGGVYFARAQLQPGDKPTAASEQNLKLALQTYGEAQALAQADGDPLIIAIARLALASTYRLQGQSDYLENDLSAAQQALTQAIDEIESLLPQLEQAEEYQLLGQAYESLGAAHLQLSDVVRQLGHADDRRTHLRAAVDAFDNCIEQGERAPLDQVLVEKIIKNSCQIYRNIAQKALEEPGE